MSSSDASSSHTTANNTQTPTSADQQEREDNKPMMALPAPGDVSPSSSTPQLEVNGPDLKLDLLGPVVVNEDGSISRIDNWHEMTEIEQSNVRRILLKRNAQRLERLRAQELAAEAEAAGDK
ncbi:hypothetical protein B0O80DRAFT_503462 [Mortierella sp. GBAus27b]|nr:hypothetical protein BGX31_005706 [Mortierella sp. GBA43]KAI8346400.1 hypothetical protein B0O80DRAFT_503462 [Mortierella sp. GBAus27b]